MITNQNHENFVEILAKSPAAATKWESVKELVINDVKLRFGVEISESSVRKIQQARFVTLSSSDDVDVDLYEKQLEALPELAEFFMLKRIKEGDKAARAAAQEELLAITDLRDRMTRSRELGLQNPPIGEDTTGLTIEEKHAALAAITNIPARISQARLWGLA